MKNGIFLVLLSLAYYPIYSKEFRKNICTKPDFISEKNLRKVYLKLKYMHKGCLDSKILLNLGKRSSLAGRLSEALWASEKGLEILQANQSISISVELRLLQGSILREMNRLEEAIIVLKSVISQKYGAISYRKKEEIRLNQEKAFLQLIYTYYSKTGSKTSKDVSYLINSFRNTYPNSQYLELVNNWRGYSS